MLRTSTHSNDACDRIDWSGRGDAAGRGEPRRYADTNPVIITAVERGRGRSGRVQVYIDGEPRFDLARDTASRRRLRPGVPIEQSEIDAIVAADARRGALETAVRMLARRSRSEREIRRRLAHRKYDAQLVDQTIAQLRGMNLIDDAEFARAWAESRNRISPRGRRLLAGELRALGVDQRVADDAVTSVSESDAAYRVASKRVRSLATVDERAFRDRLGAHLQRRGFAWDVVSATVQRCLRERGARSDGDPAEAIE